ncbi:hypothetical protein HYH03_004851 [Edaphochlamys debaryana]|uniref:Uncharacterized protein n=1 Tax=Edaphochlamys debaryana TaxID=47281 RepID=A0A835Y6K7_9CHLO|nr:hypothetical protein HYH03_004851 [Edaphochlamys debaryana]|eukprot:KAG2497267.1 hypothetical protein HYH03_004851 [Edaphochlamys debaryana]
MATCATDNGQLLLHADLLPRILAELSSIDGLVVRLLSKDARRAYDQQATGLRLVATSERTVENVEQTIRGILGRGCKPHRVTMDIGGALEQQQTAGELMLSAFADGKPSSKPVCLTLPGATLNKAAADLIASAFPQLQRLHLTGDITNDPAPVFAIKRLLSRKGSALTELDLDGAIPHQAEIAVAGAVQLQKLKAPFVLATARHIKPLTTLRSLEALSIRHCEPSLLQPLLLPLTALTSLDLGSTEVKEQEHVQPFTTLRSLEALSICQCKPDLLQPLLSPLTALTSLDLGRTLVEDREHVASLTSLRSLEALSIGKCEPSLLQPLLQPLTALTSLDLGGTEGQLPSALAALSRLASLTARDACLDVDTLPQLSALTKLHVECLVLPPAAEADAQWQLPPRLERVRLGEQTPEVLHALRGSPLREATWHVTLCLEDDKHYHEQGDALALKEEGEAALCAAAGFLEGRMSGDSEVTVRNEHDDYWLPVGGAAEVGPGRRNHTAWLDALSRAGVPSLDLTFCMLSCEDLAAITRNIRLKVLNLKDAKVPERALLLLPDAPQLETLTLASAPSCDLGRCVDNDSPGLRMVLLALLKLSRLTVVMDDITLHEEEEEAADQLLENLQAEARQLGVDPSRLRYP